MYSKMKIEVFHDKVYDEAKELAEVMNKSLATSTTLSHTGRRSLTIPFLDYLFIRAEGAFLCIKYI